MYFCAVKGLIDVLLVDFPNVI